MARPIVLLMLACGLAASTATDAAAQRKGLIVGFGIGPGFTDGDVYLDFDATGGLAADFKLGGMVGESVQLYVTSKSNTFSHSGSYVTSNLSGVGVTYQMPSRFAVNGAIGLAVWADYDWDWEVGFGLGGGVGYEFADRWIVNLDGTWGRVSDANVFNVLLTVGILSH